MILNVMVDFSEVQDGFDECVVVFGLLMYLKNIIWGISCNICVEVDKDICLCVFIIVLMMKIDIKFEEEDVVVKFINVKE